MHVYNMYVIYIYILCKYNIIYNIYNIIYNIIYDITYKYNIYTYKHNV